MSPLSRDPREEYGMSIRVTVVDEETGDTETSTVQDGDYAILTTDPCYVHHIAAYGNGTHVLTVKGRKPGL
jgi:hypothetical protein